MKSIAVGVFASVRRNVFTFLMLGLLAACGGGGGGGGDTTAPDVTLLGANPLNLIVDDTYTDPGATASDNVDGDITANIVVGGDTVNTAVANTYVVTYDVSDAAGNPATQVTRTVIVSTLSSISGTVAGTEIIAVNDSGAIVASDDTTGKTQNADGSYPFTLTGIPVGVNIRVYLITASGVYPLYFAGTNVFSLSAVAAIDLGFVDTTSGQAIPENDPTAITEVSAGTENTDTLVIVTDENTGAPLSGATVIVDHATEDRQIVTTTTAGSASFTPPSSGPVTITIGMSGYAILTLVDFNLVFLNIELTPTGLSAFIQGRALNFTGPLGAVSAGNDDLINDRCPSCENLYDGTLGDYKLEANIPNRVFNLSAIDYGSGTTPINFTAVTGLGPLADGDTLIVDLTFPITPPTMTITTGTITVPASLGSVDLLIAGGLMDVGDPVELFVGISDVGSTLPDYTLTTFDFAGGGLSTSILARAEGTAGGVTHSVNRGVGFGGTGVDFSLIDIPTILLPTGDCGGIAPAISWTGVTGASFYGVDLGDFDTAWTVIIDGGSTSFTLPDLTDTPLAGLGLTTGDQVELGVWAMVVPGFNFNTLDKDTVMGTFTDMSNSSDVFCIP